MQALHPPDDPRFTLIRMLGTGGMGVVYEAYDRRRDRVVALKTLRVSDAAAFYNFKKEFRALAGVSHPNLVTLYELVADGDACFFTMELVEGVSFVDYARPARLDVERLRAALSQLAAGVQALHDAGRLHRDLKPGNVLVTGEGRVVILDFGLAKDLEPSVDPQTLDEGFSGTLPYLAPEVTLDEPATPQSDWYAVGVMVFEALTGRRPFEGNPLQVTMRKTERDAPSPTELAAGLPEDLVALVHGLLARDPRRRPCGPDLLLRLGVRATASTLSNAVSLGEMLEHRLRRLPAGAEALLSTLALAAHPLAAAVAYEAAELTGDEHPLMAVLAAARLVRGFDDPEALFEHFLHGGEAADAARHACRAARKAAEALAFDHAAWFYERAFEHGTFTGRERRDLLDARAESLSNAGRPGEAAAVFLETARQAAGREALRRRQQAAHEYLSGGYFDQGFAVMREVLAPLGLQVPPSRAGQVLSLLGQRWRLWRRGLDYRLRDPDDDDALLRVDACRTVASYLATVEPLLGLGFQSRHLRLALDAGDGVRIGRALAIEAMTRGMRGEPARSRVAALREEVRALAGRLGEPLLDGLWQLTSAMNAATTRPSSRATRPTSTPATPQAPFGACGRRGPTCGVRCSPTAR